MRTDEPEVPTDGDDRSMGGTNQLAGFPGIAIGIGAVIIIFVVAAIILTVVTERPGPNL